MALENALHSLQMVLSTALQVPCSSSVRSPLCHVELTSLDQPQEQVCAVTLVGVMALVLPPNLAMGSDRLMQSCRAGQLRL
jgi:hypothetical protein